MIDEVKISTSTSNDVQEFEFDTPVTQSQIKDAIALAMDGIGGRPKDRG